MGGNLAVKKMTLSHFILCFLLKTWGDVAFMGAMFNVCTLGEPALGLNP